MLRRTARPPALLVVAAALTMAACGDGGARTDGAADPGSDGTVAASSGATGPSSGASAGPSTLGSPSASAGADSGGSASSSGVLPTDHLLVASERGVELVGFDGSVRSLTSAPASRAYDDGAGGVVFADPRGTAQGAPSPAVRWLPPGGGEPRTVLPEGLGTDGVDLLDAGVVDGRPIAIVAVYENGNGEPGNFKGSVQRVSLPDGERSRIRLRNTFESGFDAASLGTDTVVIDAHSEAANSISVYRVDGMRSAIPANPLGGNGCGDRADCPYGMAVSADGSTVAWMQEGKVLVRPANASRPAATTALTVSRGTPTQLDVSTRYVLATAGIAADGPPSASTGRYVDLQDGSTGEVAVTGVASLTIGRDG